MAKVEAQALAEEVASFRFLICSVVWCELLQSSSMQLEMMKEIINLPQLPPKTSALEMLTFLHDNQLQEVYPNLWIALRIALTLPITVASAERSFSILKLIKTYGNTLF